MGAPFPIASVRHARRRCSCCLALRLASGPPLGCVAPARFRARARGAGSTGPVPWAGWKNFDWLRATDAPSTSSAVLRWFMGLYMLSAQFFCIPELAISSPGVLIMTSPPPIEMVFALAGDLPSRRSRQARADANRRLSVLLRVQRLQGGAAPQARGLLRVLLVWIRDMPAECRRSALVALDRRLTARRWSSCLCSS